MDISAFVMVLTFASSFLEGKGSKHRRHDDPVNFRRAQNSGCFIITSTINVPLLEKEMKGDVMVTYQVVSKLQCEDLCMRTPQCQGFNYGEQKCDILSKIYDPHEREKSVSIRAVMKKLLLGKDECAKNT